MQTIAAIATAAAPAAIGIVRISGAEAFSILERVFFPARQTPSQMCDRRMIYGEVRDASGEVIDRCLAVRFAAPNSYTGEDCAELHCHGSPLVLQLVLESLFAAGARQAEAGEFTRRAFLNARMDLTEAEAVADLLGAETAAAAKNAAAQLGGALRRRIETVYERLMDTAAKFYAAVDYPDDEIEELREEELTQAIDFALRELREMLGSFSRGHVLKNGVKTAIIGAPNAGKSSLLNALVGFDRAIVTDIAGTTRDTVEERAVLGGVLLRLIDTAGIRETADAVERLGVERSRRAVEDAELIFALIDGTVTPGAEELEEFFAPIRLAATSAKPWILVQTKCDLGGGMGILIDEEGWSMPAATLSLSSVTGEGFDLLEDAVRTLYPVADAAAGTLLTNPRHADAVTRALHALEGAKSAAQGGMTADVILTDVEDALAALGELSGKTLREDLVHAIFSRFCVGK